MHRVVLALTLALTSFAVSQTGPAAPAAAGAAIADVLAQLEQGSQTATADLGRVRTDKWKADSSVKQDGQEKSEALQRNMTAALPELIRNVRSAPNDLAPLLKLYRNVNVLYDVLGSLTESTGAFGSKDDYKNLDLDLRTFDTARRSLADQLETLATVRDAELARFRSQAARASNTSVKKIIVDDDTPPKPKKKKPAATTAKPQ